MPDAMDLLIQLQGRLRTASGSRTTDSFAGHIDRSRLHGSRLAGCVRTRQEFQATVSAHRCCAHGEGQRFKLRVAVLQDLRVRPAQQDSASEFTG